MRKKKYKPLIIPEEFKQTMVILDTSPEVVLQQFISQLHFYQSFCKLPKREKMKEAQRLLWTMCGQKQSKLNVLPEGDLADIGYQYLNQLLRLSFDELLSAEQQEVLAVQILRNWQMETLDLLNYDYEVLLESGQTVRVTFTALLIFMMSGNDVRGSLTEFMDKASLPYLDACERDRGKENNANEIINDIYANVLGYSDGLFSAAVIRGMVIPEKYQERYQELKKAMRSVDVFKKRLAGFKGFFKDWYNDLVVN